MPPFLLVLNAWAKAQAYLRSNSKNVSIAPKRLWGKGLNVV
jgi:hypothetical protein